MGVRYSAGMAAVSELQSRSIRQADENAGLNRGRHNISNQCARLIANTIIYYNSAILSHLLTKCEASGNAKAVALITRMSPAAWRHILLNGHYTFQSGGKMIDLDALLAGLDLE